METCDEREQKERGEEWGKRFRVLEWCCARKQSSFKV
jgi:hypothetical protein